MNKKNKIKTKKLMVLFSLLFSLILANFGSILIKNWNNSEALNDFNPIYEDEVNQFEEIPTSSQVLNYSGSGENINVTLHQSIIDTTTKQFSNLDVSSTFTEPFPNFAGYNSSFVNITIDNIFAPNKTIIVEDEEIQGSSTELLFAYYTSFQVIDTCYIENLSILVSHQTATPPDQDIDVYIYNSFWDGSYIKYNNPISSGKTFVDVDHSTMGWENITNWHQLLNVSETFNNTFFVRVSCEFDQDGYWHYGSDGAEYNSIVWRQGGSSPQSSRDMSLKVGLSPKNNTPLPSQINLRINDTIISDITQGSGVWNPSESLSSNTDELMFNITADWWEVSCDVTKVQLNYTKSDINAQSDFEILGSGQVVQWNTTIPTGLNLFDNRITDHNTINFTIPSTWIDNTIKVFNVSEIGSSDINKRLLNNGYREVQVLNAGNGTLWCLTANSTNLFSSIDTYINDIAISSSNIANFSSVIEFNATFSEYVDDGFLNLSVYSPTPHYMNNTVLLDISSGTHGSEILVDNWDVSGDIKDYGVFLVQMSWYNDTAAAYLEKYITIFADTQITTTIPRSTFDSGDTFDVEVLFSDNGLPGGIDGATLTYSLNGGIDRTANINLLGSGYYNITIDCNDTEFVNYGDNTIDVAISKQYFNNQTDSKTITIIGETNAEITNPPDSSVFNSTETIDLTVFYNNTVRDVGIDGAIIEYSLDGSAYKSTSITDNLNGTYDIAISATDSDFNGYGIKTIIVNSSKQFYYDQSNSITITILGETSLSSLKIPDKVYYNSSESFTISIDYEDTARTIGISGATIEYSLDGSAYKSTNIVDNLDGTYDITVDTTDSDFNGYGLKTIIVNSSKIYYYYQSDSLDVFIVGNVSLAILSPAENSVYIDGDIIPLTIEYYDTVQTAGIDGATIEYSLNDGNTYKSTSVVDNTDGTYDISINADDSDFPRYGFVDIIINASKYLYENASITFTFHRQINTDINPFNDFDLGSIRRGLNETYTFNYSDDTGKTITQATMTIIDDQGFGYYLQNHGNGNYTIHLDSTNAAVMDDHVFRFNISSTGNETQTLQLTIDVSVKQTAVANIEYFDVIARHTGDNQSIRFYFNDTTNIDYVPGVTTSDIVVRNFATGTLWTSGDFWLIDSWDNGTYRLEVDMGTRLSGWYTLEVNVSKFPDYEVSIFLVTFYFRGNDTDINLISLEGPVGIPLTPSGIINYTIFEESDLYINFNLTDSDDNYNLVIGDADTYTVSFFNLDTSASGMLATSINFQTQSHVGTIDTSDLTPGRYLINITTSKINYENASFAFNLTIIEKYQVRLTSVYQPPNVDAGNTFTLIIRAEYYNGTDWLPIIGSVVQVTPYFDGTAAAPVSPILINGSESEFEITVNINALNMNLNISLQSAYYHQSTSIPIANIEINPAFSIADLIPYFILFGALLVCSAISVGVYRGAILPKKREKQRILTEVKTIFDDAINLEHILVLYKGTGTCVYFKSYGSEEIDPELIGGFLSAVSSFGKEMVAQEALNEISYGDKMLLLADGVYIRVALVLGKKGSLILRRNLKRFIEAFEDTYKDILPKWRGQLNHFMNAGQIVDDLLNTSIILPHQISYDFSNIKDLKISHSKDILKVAHNCCEEADRKFFFIATLLKEAADSTNKDTAEIFMGIKELRDKRMLIPIEISAIEAQPISQQEMNLISQKVSQIASLTNEEKQKLVSDLSQVGPAEREAYLTSFSTHQKIVSAPIKSKVGTTVIDDKKTAKKELKILIKAASNLKNKKDYPKSIETYRRAAVIASNWELPNEFIKLEEDIRKTTIEDLQYQKKIEELEAKDALKKKDYAKSAVKFKEASRIASEIFKLGVTDMMKEVKRLTNKANEMDKLK